MRDVMRKRPSSLLGLVVMGSIWAAGWGLAGCAAAPLAGAAPAELALAGFAGGALFFAALWVAPGCRTFDEWPLRRFARLGGAIGLALGAAGLALGLGDAAGGGPWPRAVLALLVAALLGALSGAGAALLFRGAPRAQRS